MGGRGFPRELEKRRLYVFYHGMGAAALGGEGVEWRVGGREGGGGVEVGEWGWGREERREGRGGGGGVEIGRRKRMGGRGEGREGGGVYSSAKIGH